MGVIVPNNENNGKAKIKKKYLLLLALLLLLFNLVFFIWYFTTEKKKYFNDKDGDGYGNIEDYKDAKIRPWGFVDDHSDTDDKNPCVPDSMSQACVKIKEPTKTDNTGPGVGPPTGPENFSCPNLKKNVGDPCSDGDTNTLNDQLDTNCNCKGTPKGKFNCPTLSKNIGDPCDDGNPKTVDDKVNSNCICVGNVTTPKDDDGDEIINLKDACPTRKGPSSNAGCPIVNIKVNNTINIDEKSSLSLEYDEALPSDQIRWDSKGLSLSSGIGKSIEITADIVGNYRLNFKISNKTDGFELENSHIIKVRMSNSRLEKELKNIAEVGNNKLLKIEGIEDKGNESKNYLARCIGTDITLNKGSKSGSSTPIKYDKFIDELLSVKRSIDTHIRNIKISKIDYEEISGKIKSFSYSIN